jgi:hypothetical protein
MLSFLILSQGTFLQSWCMANIVDSERNYLRSIFIYFVAHSLHLINYFNSEKQKLLLDEESRKKIDGLEVIEE